jgi:hypothetical protein
VAAATAVLLTVYSFAILLNTSNRAGDFYWSIMIGRAELSLHAPVRHAIFTYAVSPHHPAVMTEWLYDALLAGALKIVPAAVIIIAGYVAALAAAWWYLRVLHVTKVRMAVALTALAWFYAPYAAEGRALTCSLILFPILLALLHLSRTNPRLLCTLPPLFLLWINVHGSALLGLGVLAVFALLSWLPLKNPLPKVQLVLAFAASLAATFLTPWGPGLDLYDLRLSNNPAIHLVLPEWQPADLASLPTVVILAAVLITLLRAVRHRAPLTATIPVVILLAGWLDAVRILPYLAIAAVGLVLADQAPLVSRHWARLLPFAAAAGVVFALLGATSTGTFAYSGADIPPPFTVVSYLSTHHVTGRVLAYDDWEGYLMTQGYQSFVDGRFDVFPLKLIYAEGTLASPKPRPLPLLNHFSVTAVLWPANLPLTRVLLADHWILVAHSSAADLFLRPKSSPIPYVSGVLHLPKESATVQR